MTAVGMCDELHRLTTIRKSALADKISFFQALEREVTEKSLV